MLVVSSGSSVRRQRSPSHLSVLDAARSDDRNVDRATRVPVVEAGMLVTLDSCADNVREVIGDLIRVPVRHAIDICTTQHSVLLVARPDMGRPVEPYRSRCVHGLVMELRDRKRDRAVIDKRNVEVHVRARVVMTEYVTQLAARLEEAFDKELPDRRSMHLRRRDNFDELPHVISDEGVVGHLAEANVRDREGQRRVHRELRTVADLAVRRVPQLFNRDDRERRSAGRGDNRQRLLLRRERIPAASVPLPDRVVPAVDDELRPQCRRSRHVVPVRPSVIVTRRPRICSGYQMHHERRRSESICRVAIDGAARA